MNVEDVIYREFEPVNFLKGYVKKYWYFKLKSNGTIAFEIIPDGYFDILIMFNNGSIIDVKLTGIWDKTITVNYSSDVEIFGIRFMPLALESIYSLRINELLNDSVGVELKDFCLNKDLINDSIYKSSIINMSSIQTNNKVNIIKSDFAIFDYLNNHFSKLLANSKINNKIKNIFELIESNSGIYSIADISNEIGISQRHIRRICNELLGMSPKDYSRIVRFRENLTMKKCDNNDFYGYFDQSHFIKDFKRFTGTTPQNLNLNDVRFLQYYYLNNQ